MRSVLTLLFLSFLCTCVRAQNLIPFGHSCELRANCSLPEFGIKHHGHFKDYIIFSSSLW